MARLPDAPGPRRLPGGRHGTGQDDPDAGAAPARTGARRARGRCCWSARRRWSATGRRRRPASRPSCRCWSITEVARKRGAEFQSEAPASTPWCSPATRCCIAMRNCSQQVHWAGVILDEAQNIKNPETKQARPRGRSEGGLPHRADRHAGREQRRRSVVDHGVPQPGFLGSQARFRKRLLRADPGARAIAERRRALARMTAPFILRRLKTDKSIIADLPEKIEMKVFCNADQGAGVALRSGGQGGRSERSRRRRASSARGWCWRRCSKLKQVCNHPAQFLKRQLGDRRAAAANWRG